MICEYTGADIPETDAIASCLVVSDHSKVKPEEKVAIHFVNGKEVYTVFMDAIGIKATISILEATWENYKQFTQK